MKRIVLTQVLLAMMLAGCNPADAISDAIGDKITEKVTEKIIEKALESDSENHNVDVDVKDGQISIKTDKGEVKVNAGADAKLPDNFPKDVYVPKDAKIVLAMDIPDGFTVTFHSKLPASQIMDKYLAEAKSQKWEKKAMMDMGVQKIATFSKDTRTLNVMIAKKDQSEGTMGHITVSLKK